jgi:hypothetical protein
MPIVRPAFERGIQDVCKEISVDWPREFLYFPSPAAMWRDFDNWKSKITAIGTEFWVYQLPLCDPKGMHHLGRSRSTRPAFNFAATRYSPGVEFALCETADSDETSGTVIENGLHSWLWEQMLYYERFTYRLLEYYAGGDEGPLLDFDGLGPINIDPGVSLKNCCFIGPETWLLHELACVDFCHNVLGITRNERLYGGLEALVEHGSYCGTFGRLCVVCERPVKIEVGEKSHKFFFADGEEFVDTWL